MNKIKYFILFILLVSILSCDNLDISTEQSDSFVKFFGSSLNDYGTAIKEVSDGYVMLANVETEDNGKDIALIKVNKQGNMIWEKEFGGGGDDIGNDFLLLDDGGFVIVGTYEDTLNNNTQIYLLKITGSGDEEWAREIGTANNEEGVAIKSSSSGFIIAGSTTRRNIVNNNPEGRWDILLVKTDDLGNVEWETSFGGDGDDKANDVLIQDNGYFILGTTNSFSEPGQANNNIIAIKTNLVGGETDRLTYGGSNNDFGSVVLPTDDGGYVIVGSVENVAGSNSDVFLIKTQDYIHEVDWSKSYGTTANDYGYDMVVTNSGYVLVGSKELSTGRAGYFIKVDFNVNIIL
ncbi:MAG: hypothetical protein ACLFVR_09530 [Thiohalospira sp.]